MQAFFRARQADFQQARSKGTLAGNESRSSCGTTVLAVAIGKQDSVVGDAVDVRRVVSHRAPVVGTDVKIADVVAPDHQDVGFVLGGGGTHKEWQQKYG